MTTKIKSNTDYYYFSKGRWSSFIKLCDECINIHLPIEFRNHTGVRKFISDLIIQTPMYDEYLNPIDEEFQKIGFYANHLRNHYPSIYHTKENQPRDKQKNNPINPESGKSVLELLIDANVLIKEKFDKKRGIPNKFKLSSSFLNDYISMYKIKLRFLNNFNTQMNTQIKNVLKKNPNAGDLTFNLKRNLFFEKDTIKLTDNKLMRLCTLFERIINNGYIGCNYISTDLIKRFINGQINRLDTWMQKTSDALNTDLELLDSNDNHIKIYSGVLQKFRAMITNTSLIMDNGQILYHRAALKVAITGRITPCHNLGLIGLSRDLKADNYERIENIIGEKIFNYDLRASQVAAILTYGRRINLTFKHLEKYVFDLDWKNRLAKRIGIPVDLVKRNILSLMFGASGTISKYNNSKSNAFTKNCLKFGIYKKHEQKDAILKFNDECKGIIDDINLYLKYIYDILNTLEFRIEDDETWYSNGCIWANKKLFKRKFKEDDTKSNKNYKYKKAISSFLLQGIESYFIYTLIDMSKDYDYKILSYEYDGIICIGKIPQEAIEKTIIKTEFYNAILEVKNIN